MKAESMVCLGCYEIVLQPNVSVSTDDYMDNGHAIICITFLCDRCGYRMLVANADAQWTDDGCVQLSNESYYDDDNLTFSHYNRYNRTLTTIPERRRQD